MMNGSELRNQRVDELIRQAQAARASRLVRRGHDQQLKRSKGVASGILSLGIWPLKP
jgi:hypothetical protein